MCSVIDPPSSAGLAQTISTCPLQFFLDRVFPFELGDSRGGVVPGRVDKVSTVGRHLAIVPNVNPSVHLLAESLDRLLVFKHELINFPAASLCQLDRSLSLSLFCFLHFYYL